MPEPWKGKRELKISLKTTDSREAKTRYPGKVAEVERALKRRERRAHSFATI
jgi:hypothetical protein